MSDIPSTARDLQALWLSHHAWFIGFALVAIISYTRFNTPPTSRLSTTWGRYHTFAALYMLVSLVIWIVLANTPAAVAWLSEDVAKSLKLRDDVARLLAAPLYAALALTVAIPALKPLKALDQQLRKFLQTSARIPWEAKRLSESLLRRTWLPRTALQAEIAADMRGAGFGAEAISFVDDGTEAAVWTKLACLHRHLGRWKGTASFVAIRAQRLRLAGFYDQHQTEFDRIRSEYEGLEKAARDLFSLLNALHSVEIKAAREQQAHTVAQGPPGDLIEDPPEVVLRKRIRLALAEGFTTRAKRLEEIICDLLSRALLKCGLTEGGRRAELGAMGFVVNVNPSRLFDEMLMLFAGIGALYIVVLLVLGHPTPVSLGIMIATIYLGAIVASVYPKRWAWAQASENNRVPFSGYLLSAASAFLFTLAASFALTVLLSFNVARALSLVREHTWPWGFIGAATAGMLAYLTDRSQNWPRWLEAAIQAVVTAAVGGGVWLIRARMCVGSTDVHCLPPAHLVVGAAAIAGAAIGFVVPTLYRRPESLSSQYNDWIIQAVAIRNQSGQFEPQIVLVPPKTGSEVPEGPQTVPFPNSFETSDEALAQAIGRARAWIKDRAWIKKGASGATSQ